MIDNVETLNQQLEALKQESFAATKILISMGTCGIAAGAAPILEEVKKCIAEAQLGDAVEIVETGCVGQCFAEPSVEIYNSESNSSITYSNVYVMPLCHFVLLFFFISFQFFSILVSLHQ